MGRGPDAFEDFLARFPRSPFVPQASYYRSKCLGEQDGRERDALAAYKELPEAPGPEHDLSEDAEISIVDLAMRLYDRGDKAFVREVESPDRPSRTRSSAITRPSS